jgi:peptidyl-dipeptidase Dcp
MGSSLFSPSPAHASPVQDPQLPSGENPLLSPSPLLFEAPDFSRIREEHFIPAFEVGMREHLEEVGAIAGNPAAPSFENTIVALERTGATLNRVQRVFGNLTGADTNPELQRIQAQMAPRLASHSDDILLNPGLFARVEALWEGRAALGLSAEEERALKYYRDAFIRAGARLTEAQKVRIRAINEEVSSLTTEFQRNLLALGQERAVLVDRVEELAGLDEGAIRAAAEAARARGEEGKWLLPITNTTRQPVLTALENRELRRRVWEASANRGIGENGGLDNRPIVLRLAALRAERAQLLGYEDWGSFALELQMAANPEAALAMLTDLAPKVRTNTEAEAAAIAELIRSEGGDPTVQPWDWEFYAEKVRAARYAVDDREVRPFFELDRVLKDGVFFTMNRLFGISFNERFDLPVYHPSVRVFDVLEADGTPIGLFYADYFARPSKRGGAWMSSFVSQSGLLEQRPVIVNVMNIPEPVAGEPALLTFSEVSTMFHEMGHALHGLFSDIRYPSLAGTAVSRDFVEYPSTFQEDWAIEPEVLANYARHHETGDPIPAELLDRVLRARQFNQGFDTLEYLSAALLDLAWHSLAPDEIPSDPIAFEAEALRSFGVDLAAVPPRYRTPYFAHIWSGGYSASYYAYIWSEVLAADAFEFMQEKGGLTRENGDRFRSGILSRGNTQDPMEMYRAYRGGDPSVDALLRRRGLVPALP